MLRPLLVALGLMLLCAGAASAQSFDCRKAATAYENALCENPELGRLDETLAQAWATALGGLSKPAAETMRSGQRQWLDYIQRDCSASGEPPDAYSDDDQACLHSDLYNRIRALERSRMLGGWRFYVSETFSVTPTTGTETWSKPATRSFSYPLIDSGDPVARAFNRFVRDQARTIEENTAALGEEDADEIDIFTTLEVTSAGPRRISMRLEVSWYGHGAAHPNYSVNYLHYLTEEDRALEAGDIFTGRGWQKRLAGLVEAALKDQLGDGMWADAVADLPDWVADPTRWAFSEQGLVVQFQPYEVTAYAAGAPAVTIPWIRLEADLTANGEAISY